MARYAYHQSDGNEREIVEALKRHGFSVYKIGRPVDLLLAKNSRNYIAEVKTPKGKLRDSQARFIQDWRGAVLIFRTVEDVSTFARLVE